ncbi:hypothetical protein [Treponema endosymbiont of Eucomonympha sp.]|uniref:hypothetical protein n=1 Tax=Treponema endosymbiont of Eucomonympha sp. TaxID=1580831 RepID=UPI000782FE7B|nr:hypothetical protein [Treponema endosymbiont of Eucomonympha sp.]
MPIYGGIQKEETLKGLVRDDYFPQFGYEPNIGNIDFVITDKKTRADLFSDGAGSSKHYLWAEAKKGAHDVFDMFTQLILTCKKTYETGEHLAPPWLGCFDEARIAFVPFHALLPIFTETDFNWNQTPSNHETADFQKAREKVTKLIGAKIAVYAFGADDRELKEFIKTHFAEGASASIKSPITKDNFVQIFIKWVKEVKPFINIPKEEWTEFKQKGILDCDFYRADLMSEGGNTITEKLKIVLKNDNYQFQEHISGRLFTSDIGFADGGAAYSRFWNRYERPPAPVFRQHIIDRRDLLVPQNIREVKGSFFTPKIWADKSKEYLKACFGENWQEEYYVWDCAAGTGNLLAGLSNEYNVWASDVEQGNVETMQSLIDIDENLNLLSGHVFQFDFLNDSFDKLPEELKKIIGDPEKRKKLIVYINPPYAEASNYGERENKAQVAATHKTSKMYKDLLGRGINELFAQFFVKIYHLIPGVKLASFSTLKYINSQNFVKFREFFKAEYKAGFICQANTFDNVTGKFPIGFLIWDLSNKKPISAVMVDVLGNDKNLTDCFSSGEKTLYATENGKFIINWLKTHYDNENNRIGYLRLEGTDFQTNSHIFITSNPSENDIEESKTTNITQNNIAEMCIYFTVRHVFEHTWINHNDQFLYPNDGYKTDIGFQNDCLIYTLFHGKNNISVSSVSKTNHWLPFTEKEVGAREKFESAFMSGFLKGKTLSAEATAVLNAGREVWKHYHAKIKNNKTAPVNASFYDIREYFQGRKESGAMNTTSTDETYTALLAALRGALKTLALKIQPKVYEYGFLKE